MLEIKKTEMFIGDGMREVVIITTLDEQRIYYDERIFHIETEKNGDIEILPLDGVL